MSPIKINNQPLTIVGCYINGKFKSTIGYKVNNMIKSFRKYLAMLIFPELFLMEIDLKNSKKTIVDMMDRFHQEVKSKEKGISSLNKRLKRMHNKLSKMSHVLTH